MKRLKARVVVLGDYGVVKSTQSIEFDDRCPICSKDGLEIKGNRYCSDGEFYWTDNINCHSGCI